MLSYQRVTWMITRGTPILGNPHIGLVNLVDPLANLAIENPSKNARF